MKFKSYLLISGLITIASTQAFAITLTCPSIKADECKINSKSPHVKCNVLDQGHSFNLLTIHWPDSNPRNTSGTWGSFTYIESPQISGISEPLSATITHQEDGTEVPTCEYTISLSFSGPQQNVQLKWNGPVSDCKTDKDSLSFSCKQ
jgi:hypothetical protein